MTPAIKQAEKAKISFQIHTYEHDPNTHSYGEEAAIKMNVSASQVFKTLVVAFDPKTLIVAILPVNTQLDLKAVAKFFQVKKAKMADPKAVEGTTGYVLGGVSPLGQRKKLKTIIDHTAQNYETIYVSAGKRGLEIELSPQDLNKLVRGTFTPITK